jgi:hypothetical protein
MSTKQPRVDSARPKDAISCPAAVRQWDEQNRSTDSQNATAVDPIFAAIEEWKTAEAETLKYETAAELKSAAGKRAYKRRDAALDAFCACIPTTAAGLAAALAFARDKAKERKENNFLENFHELAPMFAASMATAAARIAKGGATLEAFSGDDPHFEGMLHDLLRAARISTQFALDLCDQCSNEAEVTVDGESVEFLVYSVQQSEARTREVLAAWLAWRFGAKRATDPVT